MILTDMGMGLFNKAGNRIKRFFSRAGAIATKASKAAVKDIVEKRIRITGGMSTVECFLDDGLLYFESLKE